MPVKVVFTRLGFLAGAREIVPLTVGVLAYGLVFGALARQAGLSFTESLLMSGLVNAGSSQFVALALWQIPLPVATIIFTTFVVNLRYMLMGATLRRWFSHLSVLRLYGPLFFMGDENWALTVRAFETGRHDAAFLLGSGLPLFSATKKRFVSSRWHNFQTEFGRLSFEMLDSPRLLFGLIDGGVW